MDKFSDIRPFNDQELQASIQKLKSVKEFRMILNFYLENHSDKEIEDLLQQVDGYKAFYELIIRRVAESVISKTMDSFTYSGLDKLNATDTHLFISNHRDIICDSGLINFILFKNDHPFLEAAIGNNLVANEWVKGLIRINQNFLVQRDLKGKALLQASMHLSAYIEYCLKEKGKNIWIAQREGRTKNGEDDTQLALLRMISLNAERKKTAEYLNRLRIVPVSISYGIEPCVAAKVRETYLKELEGAYEKAEGEDVQSMVKGITANKAEVHIHFGDPINVEPSPDSNSKEVLAAYKLALDDSIIKNYNPSRNSRAAALKIRPELDYSLTEEQAASFEQHLTDELSPINLNNEKCREKMTALYAAPLLPKD